MKKPAGSCVSGSSVPVELAQWAAESLLEGQRLAEVIAALVAERYDEVEAARLCATFYAGDAGFEAARHLSEKLKKLESILTMRQELAARSSRPFEVGRREDLTARELKESYYSTNLPVVLQNFSAFAGSTPPWTVERLDATVGSAVVDVLAVKMPVSAVTSDAGGGPYRWRVPFSSFVSDPSAIESGDRDGFVHDRGWLSSSAGRRLSREIGADDRYLRVAEGRDVGLCVGLGGAHGPLGREDKNEFLFVCSGLLRVSLISPLESHCLYPDGSFSPVNCLAPDTLRYPRIAQVEITEAVLEAGETLFVPVGWWHQLDALEPTVALTLRNLALPNDFDLS